MSNSARILWPVAAISALGVALVFAQDLRRLPNQQAGSALLHNGWTISPAGTAISLPGDMPGNIVPIAGTNMVAVNTCGYHTHSISLVDIASGAVMDSVEVPRAWVGLAYDPTRQELFLSGAIGEQKKKKKKAAKLAGSADLTGAVLRFKVAGTKLSPEDPISLPGVEGTSQFVSGILADGKGAVFVANIQTDTIFRLSGADLGEVTQQKVGYRPYALALSPDGGTLAVTNWGDKSVSLLDPGTLQSKGLIAVNAHPAGMAYAPDGRLFVAEAGTSAVSEIIDGKVAETIRTSIDGNPLIGSTPVAVAVADNKLYVANADNNDLCLVDISSPKSTRILGFIPTGRYPSAVDVIGGKILVATAKGLRDHPNATPEQAAMAKPAGPDGVGSDAPYTYVGDLLAGNLNVLDVPNRAQLGLYTRQVRANLPRGERAVELSSREKHDIMASALHKIHHVIYVIRENRTYDEVYGDEPKGNGDARLTLFPRKVTPNGHALENQFVLLDNLYCDGEVSQVGHQWTDAAYANDYCEKNWPLSYSGRGEVDSDDRMFTSPGGYLWQDAKAHGKTARIYGEYLQWQEDHTSARGAVKDDPEKFGCSAAFEKVFAAGGRDPDKVQVFLNEMHAAENTGEWPNLMVMALPEDHTMGMSAGRHTPWACVASNDQALGQLVDGVSHSKFWKDTAIFVIEDDAQNGPDHVDAHRTEGFVISPYTRRNGFVDSTMYSTCSMIRTMESILDLPPMSQYDENATPMYRAFTTQPDLTPYTDLPPQIDIDATNHEKGDLERRSAMLDFSDLDRADPDKLNAILWEAIRPGERMPAPVVSASR